MRLSAKENAVAMVRGRPPKVQDEIARLVLALSGGDRSVHRLTPDEQLEQNAADAEEARGDYATDDEMRASWLTHGL